MTAKNLKKFNFIEVNKLSSICGAEIVCGDLRKIDNLIAAEIREAWLDHLVVVIRNQKLNKEDLVNIGRYFGDFQYSTPLSSPSVVSGETSSQGGKFSEFPEITVVSNIVENDIALGGLGDGDVVWHTDMSSFDEPPNQTILYAIEVPWAGGDTYFCNMYEALNTLPKATYKTINNLYLKHDLLIDAAGHLRPELAHLANVAPEESPGAIHPLIRTHPETKRNCLYLGRRSNARLTGIPRSQSDEILQVLWDHSTNQNLIWRHEWKQGDLIMWDNRCVMHRRDSFNPEERRLMHRVVIKGSQPYLQT